MTGDRAHDAAVAPSRFAPRGHVGIHTRLPSVDLQSRSDLIAAFRAFTNQSLAPAAEARAAAIYRVAGVDPKAALPMAEVLRLVADDPVIAMWEFAWLNAQRHKWTSLRAAFHANADAYLSEMDAFDRAGPGSLELSANLLIPDYCRHEIHQQPGGYIGDDFAGHMYHYAALNTANGANDQDAQHAAIAARVPTPADGRVRRVLEIGASIGQTATSLKARFPEAEVWALDMAAPMLRYAHMRAAGMGVAVNFVQRLAEDSGFPDATFDIVVSNILHHELTAAASRAVFREAHRIVRPGGLYAPIDAFTNGLKPTTAMDQFQLYWAHRWNNEVWYLEWASLDAETELAAAGFTPARTGGSAAGAATPGLRVYGRGSGNVYGVKL